MHPASDPVVWLTGGPGMAATRDAEWLPKVLSELRVYTQADIIGASYGTQVALVFLRRHPDRVRRVVLNGVESPDQMLFALTRSPNASFSWRALWLISGGLDPATPPEVADSVALELPNSTTFVDSTAGHAMFYEAQVAAITSFIR